MDNMQSGLRLNWCDACMHVANVVSLPLGLHCTLPLFSHDEWWDGSCRPEKHRCTSSLAQGTWRQLSYSLRREPTTQYAMR